MTFPIPRGSFATPMIQLRTMVSLSKEFQQQTNSDTADDALKHIGLTRVGEDEKQRPFAIILVGDSQNHQITSGGDANFLVPDGNIALYMTKNTNPLYRDDLDAATIDAANFFGVVTDEVMELSAKDNPQSDISHLPIIGGSLAIFTDSGDEEQNSLGDFFFWVYLFKWGIAS